MRCCKLYWGPLLNKLIDVFSCDAEDLNFRRKEKQDGKYEQVTDVNNRKTFQDIFSVTWSV